MNKKLLVLLIFIISIFCIITCCFFCNKNEIINNTENTVKNNIENNIHENIDVDVKNINKKSVEYNGWVKTNGINLVNEKNETVQLNGLSSHGIQWFPEILTYNNLKYLKENWNINVFRVAMYTDISSNGYISNKEEISQKVYEIIEIAKQLDIYVIIDWHILSDNNPQTYQEDAVQFFDEVSKKYAETPNVIYEICNEPNGQDVSWNNNVKPYAEVVIKKIRENSPKSLIIVGTPDWCKDLKQVSENPLNFDNVIYSCHFYAGSHKEELRKKIEDFRNIGLPIIISECGITDASGDGIIYDEEFKEWVEYLNERKISWIFWSFCNKEESSSVLLPSFKCDENHNIDESLSETGKIIKKIFLRNVKKSEIFHKFVKKY